MQTPSLLVHGITASPAQLHPQVAALRKAGAVVHTPTLSGHASDIREMDPLRWEDWYADVLRAVTNLQQETGAGAVNYMGLSWGALLGLKLALDRPDLVKRIVCIGTPIHLLPWAKCLLPFIRYTPLRYVVRYWPKSNKYCVADPSGCDEYLKSSYHKFPLSAVYQIERLQKHVLPQLKNLDVPILIMHAERDRTAPPSGAQHLYDEVPRAKQLVWLQHSYHVATLDYDRDEINQRLVEFFQEGE